MCGARVVDVQNRGGFAVYFEIVYSDGDKEELEVLELLNSLYETSLNQNETMKMSTQNTMALLCALFPSFCKFKNGSSEKKRKRKSNEKKNKRKKSTSMPDSSEKKKKRKKSPNSSDKCKIKKKKAGPKKINAYSLFTKEMFAKYRAEQPGVRRSRDIFELVSEKWKTVEQAEKNRLIERAKEMNRLACEAFEKKSSNAVHKKKSSEAIPDEAFEKKSRNAVHEKKSSNAVHEKKSEAIPDEVFEKNSHNGVQKKKSEAIPEPVVVPSFTCLVRVPSPSFLVPIPPSPSAVFTDNI